MSHDAQHGHATENKAVISFGNSFWLVIILVGLFIAAINFVQVESAGEGHEGGHGEATHEMHHGGHEAAGGHEATHEAEAHGTEATEPSATKATEEAPATEGGEAAHKEGH